MLMMLMVKLMLTLMTMLWMLMMLITLLMLKKLTMLLLIDSNDADDNDYNRCEWHVPVHRRLAVVRLIASAQLLLPLQANKRALSLLSSFGWL